jgi:hypothetical protein
MQLTVLAALTAAALASPASAQTTEWNQARGNSARTSVSSCAPIVSPPEVAWTEEFETLCSEPVVWGGVTYIAGVRDGRRSLFAFRTETGEALGSKRIDRDEGRVHLAVWAGTVAWVARDGVRFYQHRKSTLKDRGKLEMRTSGAPAVYEGQLIVSGSGGVACVDFQRGRVQVQGTASFGTPAVVPAGEGGALIVTAGIGQRPGYKGQWLVLTQSELTGLSGKKLALRAGPLIYGAPVAGQAGASTLVPVRYEDEAYQQGWFVHAASGYMAADGSHPGGLLILGDEAGGLCPMAQPVASYKGEVFGIASAGHVLKLLGDGRYLQLPQPPKNGLSGAATIAGDVLYFPNWAMEIESKRVLWSLPDLIPTTPMIPAGDRLALVGAGERQLVCLRGSLADSGAVASAVEGPRALRPTADNCAILADGTVVTAPLEGGADVSLVIAEGAAKLVGEEHPVYLAWSRALDAEYVDALEQVFETYLRSSFLDDCRRLIAAAERRGLSADRAETLNAKLVGRTRNTKSNAPAQRRRIQREEDKARALAVGEFEVAADWCAERELPVAATALLAAARGILPGHSAAAVARAGAMVPEDFPWRDEDDAGERWLAWAPEILPAGARFMSTGDERWAAAGDPWRDDTIALRTRNLVLLSRDADPVVVGRCLRNGEGAVRALRTLMGPGPRDESTRPLEPLEVRLHRNKEEYHLERTPDGTTAIGWSVGYYSSAERVSRFYVPAKGKSGDPLGRDLYQVLVHELTHHYVDQRWMGRGQLLANTPGYWIVEGFARFVEDQVVEMGRLGTGFRDETVKSLDAASQVDLKNKLIPMSAFIDLTPAAFSGLGDEPIADLELRSTLVRMRVTERGVFYEQAGSLVFFLWNRCGDEGRAAVLECLRVHYTQQTKREGWQALGYKDANVLEDAFRQFLSEVR